LEKLHGDCSGGKRENSTFFPLPPLHNTSLLSSRFEAKLTRISISILIRNTKEKDFANRKAEKRKKKKREGGWSISEPSQHELNDNNSQELNQ
jgi:hypothetical protein